jgi:prepilin-type N-terminal cleavage/methylation domain-containing protein
MKMTKKMHTRGWVRQQGLTLIELLVASVISLIAASGMILAMSSTLGTGSQTIQMARLTQEMRTAMQIMSRELRRANYHSTFMNCYGKVDCLTTLGLIGRVGVIGINVDRDCLWFWYDRPQTVTQLAITDEPVAAFRLTGPDGAGRIQMMTDDTPPNCADPDDSTNWVDLTDPAIIDISVFNVDPDASYEEEYNSGLDTLYVQKIALSMTAKLQVENSVRSWWSDVNVNPNASRDLTQVVAVRNSTTTMGVGTP